MSFLLYVQTKENSKMNKDIIAVQHPRNPGVVVLVGRNGFMDKILPFHPNLYTDANKKDACTIDKEIYESIRLKCISSGVAASAPSGGRSAEAVPKVPEVAWKGALDDIRAQQDAIQATLAEIQRTLSHVGVPGSATKPETEPAPDPDPHPEPEPEPMEDDTNQSPATFW
jgi:hypothetical protein